MRMHAKNNGKRCFVVLVVLAAASCAPADAVGPLSGLDDAQPQAAARAPRRNLTAAMGGAMCTINWQVALRNGYFRDEGLTVTSLRLDPSKAHDHIETWGRGPNGPVQTDLALAEYPSLAAMATGKLPYYVVMGEHSGCRQLIVPVNSPIQTIADLKRKRIGISLVHWTLIWEYLGRQAGLTPEDFRWVHAPVTPGSAEEAEYARREFAAGRLDAYVAPDPTGEILKADGVARHLASNTWTPALRDWYCCLVTVRRDVADAHPEVVRAVTRAMRRGGRFVEERPDEALSIGISSGYFTADVRRGLSARLLREYVWTSTGRIQEDLERYFRILIDAGRLPASASPRELVARVYRSGE